MGRSLLTCGYVIPVRNRSNLSNVRRLWTFIFQLNSVHFQFKPCSRIYMMTDKVDRQMSEWLKNRHILAYPVIVASDNQAEGAATLLQV